MSTRTTSYLTAPAFVVDHNSMRRDHGHQVNWAYVPPAFLRGVQIAKLSAAALKGAVALAVDALPAKIPLGSVLDFGVRADVVVTLTAQAAAAATALACSALTGPIPVGAILDFTGAGEMALVTTRAATGATSIAVEALDAQIESGDTATYTGGRKIAYVAAEAPKAATAVTVSALPFEIDNDDEAKFGGEPGSRSIPAGTVFCELSSGLLVPRLYRPGSETAKFLSITPITEDDDTQAGSGFGFFNGGVVAENLLPEASGSPKTISGTYKTEMIANGCTFFFRQVTDSSAA